MNKQTFSFLAAFFLIAVVALALNGGVISMTDTTPHNVTGQKGAIQCMNATTAEPSGTTWKVRLLSASPTDWNSPALRTYQMGEIADFLYTGPYYGLYEVKFFPPSGHAFTDTNPQLVKVRFHKRTIITIHYQ